MPQASKAEKSSFSVRMKAWFRTGKAGFLRSQDSELQLSPEIIHELESDQPVLSRLQTLRELQELVREKRLQQHGVELIWYKVNDLLDSPEKEVRHRVLEFLCHLVSGQYAALDIMRAQFFRFLKQDKHKEDLEYRIRLLSALTDGGKEIVHFEEEVGVFVLRLLDECWERQADCGGLLTLIISLVKFNSAYLDPDVVTRLINRLSLFACNTEKNAEILSCLEIYKCMVMYNFIPSEALLPFLHCLCRVVNLKEVCQEAWNTMRNLMGTHLGHSALYNLCRIIQVATDKTDIALIRGAVFFIGTSLWGPKKVSSLKYSAMAVLPIFVHALKIGQPHVLHEVALQLESLVVRQGGSLNAPGWEEAVTVIECLVTRLDICEASLRKVVQTNVQTAIVQLEALALKEQYLGSQTRLYDLVEAVSDMCPEQSVMHLIQYRSGQLHPARDGWIDKLTKLVDRFYLCEVRQAVRLRILDLLQETVLTNILMYEDLLLEKAVLPFLSALDMELDRTVRARAVEVVSHLAVKSTGAHLSDLLDILDRILKRIVSDAANSTNNAEAAVVLYTRQDFLPCKEAARGMVRVFRKKFHQPPAACIKRCYYSLVTVLDQIYDNQAILEHTGEIRMEIFACLLSLRARADYHLGFLQEEEGVTATQTTHFSPYVVCEKRATGPAPSAQAQPPADKGLVTLSLTRACKAVIRCLKEERDWLVLNLVLAEVPSVLQNKGMLTRYGQSISLLAKSLCYLVQTPTRLPDINTPLKFTKAELSLSVYPVLAALASYNRWLEVELQKNVIKCLQIGLLTRDCNKVCIVALTACILEMADSMYKLLPEVLLNLSKISATVHIAIPVLEFLSTLISLPKVFASFNNDQYMSVIAITLPYTNPFKFNQYTVSLAHHVIIMWFLKCRLSSRKDFVKFIVKGLEGNVLQPFAEGNFRKADLAAQNQDSSDRARSLSWKEDQSKPTRARHMTGVTARPQVKRPSGPDERQALHTFHQELTETCIDMMARYSFGNPAVQPVRSPCAEFLLQTGQSASWLLGNVIVTISVSGCGVMATSSLCEACSKACSPRPATAAPASDTSDQVLGKKRHSSEQTSRTMPQPELASLSQDDLGLREKGNILEESGGGGKETRLCSCWCQGWCEVWVRRPSGDTSWLCRLQNGQLASGLDEEGLADITSLLEAELTSSAVREQASYRTRLVARSNSNPEITDKLPEAEVSRPRVGGVRQSCDPIPEAEEDLANKLAEMLEHSYSSNTATRPRSNTIHSTSPVKFRLPEAGFPGVKKERSSLISPQFMFLQLYQACGLSSSYTEKPLLIPKGRQFENSLKILDRIPCQETHKIGVMYAGPGQVNSERDILGNRYGSARYAAFLAGLGSLIDITEVDASTVFLGGLSHKDGDGEFAYVWQDDAMQVVYHTATLMPNRESDPQFNKKKRHIGNDFVAIVYNESGAAYTMGTVKGQFIYATVVVEPLDFESNRILVLAKPELTEFLSHLSSGKVVSDHNLAMLVRQMALHCNLAANIYSNMQSKADPYASNWLERLRHIKRLKAKLLKEKQESEEDDTLYDFTGHCLARS